MEQGTFTLGEVERIETRAGQPFSDLANDDRPKGKLMRAVALELLRRDDPQATWESTADLTDAQLAAMMPSPPDPTPGPGQ